MTLADQSKNSYMTSIIFGPLQIINLSIKQTLPGFGLLDAI